MKSFFTLFNSLILGCVFFISVAQAQISKPASRLAVANNQPVVDKSLEFIQNKNQWPASVRFAANLPGGRLFLQNNSFIYHFSNNSHVPNHHDEQLVANRRATAPNKIENHAYRVNFLNAAKNTVQISGQEERSGIRNYYLGKDPGKWASGVKSYGKVTYHNLYSGVEMQLYQKGAHLKYDFLLQPHTDPQQIRMQYEGAELALQATGDLQIKTLVTTVVERKPVAYQTINGQRREVACRFKLTDKVLSFEFPAGYNPELPLLIDPELVFSSYSGSTADNWGFTATYDNAGNVYSGGITKNVGFPATAAAYDSTWNGVRVDSTGWDIAILKYNPKASGAAALIYATYLGGAGVDIPSSLIVNSKNELMILGTTGSADFPVTAGAADSVFKGGTKISPLGDLGGITYSKGSDLIISRLSADGSALLASTYMGGSQNDGLLERTAVLTRNYGDQFRSDIITDAADNVYVVSSTASADFPVKNAFQATTGGQNDAVLFKMDATLRTVAWSSYLGGRGADAGYSIQLDSANNNIFICGGTSSATLPGVTDAYRPIFLGGPADGFVAKISNDGKDLERVSYLGTGSFDQAYFVQLDRTGDVYLLGQTLGNYPVTRGVYSVRNGRQFIQKLNNNLTASVLSTVFGSNDNPSVPNISPTAFLVDDCNRIYVCGWGGGSNANIGDSYGNGTTSGLPVTADAYQRTTDGKDFYLMLLSPDAAALEYATFIGGPQTNIQSGEHVDGGTSRFDKRGMVYQAVCGGCGSNSLFPTTPNAWSRENQSNNCNNAAFVFSITTPIGGPDERVCSGSAPVQLTGFSPAGGTWSGTGISPSGLFTPSAEIVGTHVLTYTVAIGSCIASVTKTITVDSTIVFSQSPNQTVCADVAPFLITDVTPPGGTWSGKGVSSDGLFTPGPGVAGDNLLTYTVQIGACKGISTKTITVNAVDINVGVTPTECSTDSTLQGFTPFTPIFTNTTTGATGYLWDFGDGTTSTEAIPNHIYTNEGVYPVTVTIYYGNGCQITRKIVSVITDKKQLIPNIFTPNGDGKNDTFAPRITCLPTDLKVFNRWGQLIYEQKNYQNTWDGKGLPEGIYYYHLTSTTGSNWKGWVEIVR